MPTTHATLAELADAEGAAHVGWVGRGVLYARFERGMSADLGGKLAAHVHGLVADASGIHYFGDARSLTYYDLLARSAFVRMALTNRRRFASFVILTWPAGVDHAAKSFAATLGSPVEILTDALDFDVRLSRVAPLARRIIDPQKPTSAKATRQVGSSRGSR